MAMNIRRMQLADLNPADYNPRKDLQPDDPAYLKIKQSLETFGMVEPIIWNERTGHIVGGHQRIKALRDMGEAETDVVVINEPLKEEKKLNVALNKITGEWDDDKLSVILNELGEEAADTGFTLPEIDVLRDELKSYFDDVTAPDEEEPTEEPEESFLLSLTFDAADEKPLKAYIKEHSEDAVVRIIVDTVTASA
jgi:ParB-like chromosome segregation protein Spo0J